MLWFDGSAVVPFFPGRHRDDLVVVAAVEEFGRRLGRWRAARAGWSRVHGWPGGDAVRLMEEERMVGEFESLDPTVI